MKKTGFISILVIFFSFVISVSCEKDEKYDFRDEFIGIYKGYTHHREISWLNDPPIRHWYTYDDTIIVTKAKEFSDKIIIDDPHEIKTYQFILKDDSTFSLDLESIESAGIIIAFGKFKNDSMFYTRDYRGGEKHKWFYGLKQ